LSPGGLLAGIALYDVVQNAVLTEGGYVTGNVAVTTGALAWARRSGVSWDDMGLGRGSSARGLGVGAAAAAVATGVACLTRDTALVRSLLSDERLEGIGRREVWRRVLIRFPLGTALFEEVVFRGVLPAAFRHRPTWQREAISASAFAAWHIIPTWHTLDANTGGRSWGRGRKAAAVVGGSVAAGVAGLTLSALKRSSSSLTAPWLAHTTVSALTLLVAARLGEPAGRSQSSS
jgi:membrane protease YdiL (CAAX protease family)